MENGKLNIEKARGGETHVSPFNLQFPLGPRKHLRLWFNGRVMSGEWTLEKIDASEAHGSWRLSGAASR